MQSTSNSQMTTVPPLSYLAAPTQGLYPLTDPQPNSLQTKYKGTLGHGAKVNTVFRQDFATAAN